MNITPLFVLQMLTFYALYFAVCIFLLRWIWNTSISDIFSLRKLELLDSFKFVLLFHFVVVAGFRMGVSG